MESEASSLLTDLGGLTVGPPTVISTEKGSIDVFVRERDAHVFTKHYDGFTWSSRWRAIGGSITSNTAVYSWEPDHIRICGLGAPDNAVFCANKTAGIWGPWFDLGGVEISEPAVVSWAPGHVEVFVIGTALRMHNKMCNGVA